MIRLQIAKIGIASQILLHLQGESQMAEMGNNVSSLTEEYQDKAYCLLFGVRRSIRYHNRRRQFFDRISKVTDALTAIAGSGTIIAALSQNFTNFSVYLAATTAVFSAINLVFDTKGNSRLHHDLARQFISIEKDLVDPALTPAIINKAESDRLEIEAGEPPILRVLDLICHNELLRAIGREDDGYFDIKFWRSMFAHLFDVFPSTIKKTS